jgi:hypothetical protein
MFQRKEAVIAKTLIRFVSDISVGSDKVQVRAVNLTLAVFQLRTRILRSALRFEYLNFTIPCLSFHFSILFIFIYRLYRFWSNLYRLS